MTIASIAEKTGGPARSVPDLCKNIANYGHSVDLYISDYRNGSSIDHRDCGNVRLLDVNTIESRLTRENCVVSVIHDNGIWLPSNHRSVHIANFYKVPLIISTRGMLEPWALKHRRLKKLIAWHIYQKRDLCSASVIHATSVKEAGNLRKLGVTNPICVIPNGVAKVKYTDIYPKPYASGKKRILFVGRLHQVKGLINLVRAWDQIRSTDWEIIIVGPDEDGHKAEIEREIALYNLQNFFTFYGPVNDSHKWSHYYAADLFVLPSYSENFGIVVAEALSAGLPVITTHGTPWRELENRNCGWCVEVGVKKLTAALRHATEMADWERKVMGENGKKLIDEQYTWANIAQSMISVYHWMVYGGPKPQCFV